MFFGGLSHNMHFRFKYTFRFLSLVSDCANGVVMADILEICTLQRLRVNVPGYDCPGYCCSNIAPGTVQTVVSFKISVPVWYCSLQYVNNTDDFPCTI